MMLLKKFHRPPEQIQELVCNKKECYHNYDIDCCQHYAFKPVTFPVVHYQVQNYCTNKQLAEAKFFTCFLDRGHQYLAYHYDTCHAYGKEQKRLFLAPVCAVAFLYVLRSFRWRKQVFVGNERENYPKNVNDQQNDC